MPLTPKPVRAWAMQALLGKQYVTQLSMIKRTRRELVEHAEQTFFGGGYDWSYIKKQGWRIVPVEIVPVEDSDQKWLKPESNHRDERR